MIPRLRRLFTLISPLALAACYLPPQQQQQPGYGQQQPGQQPAAGQQPAYGGAAPAASTCPAVQAQPGTTDAQMVQMFTQTAWCHFSYSGGTERNERVVMTMDGRIASNGRSETSHSGTNSNQYGEQTQAWGTASASASGDQGCWKVVNGQLNLSSDGVNWQPVPTQVTQNSNGYPIVNAGGKEYATCN
ncbi:MAG TPA: hypothetical protein VMZ28_01485 [Kofleriaceae bacterium]|nr:hypothetical protein [Kofleriaceae bacterium]